MAELRKKVSVRWVLAGKRVKPHTPGAVQVSQESTKWYAVGSPLPRGKSVPLSRDKGVSQRMLAELVTRLERSGAGLPDLDEVKRPLSAWLDAWHETLSARPGSDAVWCRQIHTRLTRLVEGCRFSRASDIDPDKVTRWLADQRAKPSRAEGQLSQQTCNHYRAHLHALCAWLVGRGVLTSNPADRVPVGDVRPDLRHARRPFAPADLLPFLDGVRARPPVLKTTGPDRHALYLLACATGFRRAELSALRPSWFDLDGAPPTVVMPGVASKNGEPARQPLPTAIVPDLRAFLAGKPELPLWRAPALFHSAKMIRADLEAAGLPFVTNTPEGPRRLDFHALRHTYLTLLHDAGATAKEAQSLARHSTPSLTIGRYTHVGTDALAARVNLLPLGAPAPRALEDLSRDELLALCRWSLPLAAALVAAPGVPGWHDVSHDGNEGERPGEATLGRK